MFAPATFNNTNTIVMMMPHDQNLNQNIKQKLSYVNPCLMGFCEKFLIAGTEQLGSHGEKNRYAAYM